MNNLNEHMIAAGKYAEFVETVFQMVSNKIGEQFRVRKVCANKNNETIRWGISIFNPNDKSKDVRLTPTIYLDEYYGMYVRGCEFAEIVQHIIELYYEITSPFEFNMEDFEFDNIKDKVCFKLINQGMNMNLLESMPHRQFCDLAVTYYVQIIDDEKGVGTIPVNNSLMMFWGTDENTLWELAYKNTKNLLSPRFQTVKDAIYECTGEVIEDGLSSFTLTNKRKHFGAASVLYEETLHKIAETLQSSYFLLPSSIHEWVILADDGIPDTESCNSLIQLVNRTELTAEEILADHVYYYDRSQRKISY